MANEITIQETFQVAKGSFEFSNSDNYQATQAGVGGGNPGVVDVGTTEEDIVVGDITTLGWCLLKNLDATNYVRWGPKDTTMKAVGRLMPGETARLFLEPGITLRMIADTAPCKVEIRVFEA